MRSVKSIVDEVATEARDVELAAGKRDAEIPVITVSLDYDGDYIARDLLRPRLLIHARTPLAAVRKLIALRPQWDALKSRRKER